MPPKRKRAQVDAEAPSSRTTRSSARGAKKDAQEIQAVNTAWNNSSSRPDIPGDDDDEIQEIPMPPNKASRSGDASKAKASKAKGTKTLNVSRQEARGRRSQEDHNTKRGVSDAVKLDMYSEQRAETLFSQFADEDSPDVIGAEGFERLCKEAQVPLDGALPLLLAWQFGSHEIAKISKQEWMEGTAALRVSSLASFAVVLSDLNDLVVLGRPAAAMSHVKSQRGAAYDTTRYDSYAADTRKAFSTFYGFCFALAKPSTSSRNIDMETACALWSVVLAPSYGKLQRVNKDLWTMMLEFCRDTRQDLSNFEADGAWPTVIDDFVRWKNAQTAVQPADALVRDA
ncbi:Cullin binding-domain-containing protein [Russula vinacea]|nr:Cullin binding-domain-containing protein [Russula vinacea]